MSRPDDAGARSSPRWERDGDGATMTGLVIRDIGAATSSSGIGLPAVEHQALLGRVMTRLFGDDREAPAIDRYEFVRRLGVGGMGIVYLVRDPALRRLVALKLLHPKLARGVDAEAVAARLRREARAMARLDHPNVVRVLEVGEHEGRTFLVMEYVEGTTLARWLAADRARPWREVVRAFLGAGEGLAAAHEAGMAHCDFKPDNVLMGESGAIKVADFGLVSAHDQATSELLSTWRMSERSGSMRSIQATGPGGTPAFMAPEQLAGGRGGPRSDQFSFCVALYAALHGIAPFTGESVEALQRSVLAGPERAPPNRRIPRALHEAIVRGLAVNSAERWPSMAALLESLRDALEARTRRLRFGLVGLGLGLALVAAGAVGYQWHARARQLEACADAGERVAEVWSDDARAAVRDGLSRAGARYAEETIARVLPALDRHADAWRSARVDACAREQVERRDADARARLCLEQQRLELAARGALLARADAATSERAALLVTRLPSPSRCLDDDALAALPAPPPDEQLEAVLAAFAEVAATQARVAAERPIDPAPTAALLERAEAIGWAPLTAAARRLQARARSEDAPEYMSLYRQAYVEAAGARAWDVARLAARDAAARSLDRGRLDEAALWLGNAEVARVHAGDPDGAIEAQLAIELVAPLARARGDRAAAIAALERAIDLLSRTRDADDLERALAHRALADALREAGDLLRADAARERSASALRAALGDEHPWTRAGPS
ncbi:MAG: serine/threonine-protein kinase [Nannocystaceae bacterium]